jgi:cell division protein FtsL
MVHKKYQRRRILAAAAACLAVMAVLTFYLWHLTENVRLGYAITKARDEIRATLKDITLLETEREALSSPEVIERIARERLGLQALRDDQVVYEKRR